MSPIQQTLPSSQPPFFPQNFHTPPIESALSCLQKHQELLSNLSKKKFITLQKDDTVAEIFQEVFGLSQKQCSYDHIIELRLNEWAKSSQYNQKATERIVSFLQDTSKHTLDLTKLSLTDLPDIWQHSAFTARLEKLNLEYNQLSFLPNSIGHLVRLQELSLDHNRLASLPKSLKNLFNLQWLYLNSNQLTRLPQSFGLLSHLQELNLEDNRFTSLPESFGNLSKLRRLDLNNNQLSSLPESFGNLSNLQRLDLRSNQLVSLFESFGNLSSLQWLSLYKNQLICLTESFGNLLNLRKLSLGINRLTFLPESLKNLSKLQHLYLNDNNLTSFSEPLKHLVQLQELDLRNNQLTSLPEHLQNFSHLQRLNLKGNLTLSRLPQEIFRLPQSCEINLERCGLSTYIIAQTQTHMSTTGYRGPRILFSFYELPSSFKTTQQLLNELFIASETLPFALPNEWNNKESLKIWLHRLSSMADYNAGSGVKRKALASMILSFLMRASNDSTFQAIFFTIIQEAIITCGDRMALSILHLGIAYKLSLADKKDLKRLATLLTRGSFALESLQEIAFNKVQTLFGCDPIEVYLGYPVMLKETLQLPIDVEEMLYFQCSFLQEEDLESAKNIVLSRFANQNQIYRDLCKRDLWIEALQENYPDKANEIITKKQTLLHEQNYDCKEVEEAWVALTKEALAAWSPLSKDLKRKLS